MTKEEMIICLSVIFAAIFIVVSIVYYMQGKTIKALRNKIEELDNIYFDEIAAMENIIFEKESEINRANKKLNQKTLIRNNSIQN